MKLGELIKQKRKLKNLTQSELAHLMGYTTPQFISLLESGKARLPISSVSKLAVILDLNEDRLMKLALKEKMDLLKKKAQSKL